MNKLLLELIFIYNSAIAYPITNYFCQLKPHSTMTPQFPWAMALYISNVLYPFECYHLSVTSKDNTAGKVKTYTYKKNTENTVSFSIAKFIRENCL